MGRWWRSYKLELCCWCPRLRIWSSFIQSLDSREIALQIRLREWISFIWALHQRSHLYSIRGRASTKILQSFHIKLHSGEGLLLSTLWRKDSHRSVGAEPKTEEIVMHPVGQRAIYTGGAPLVQI